MMILIVLAVLPLLVASDDCELPDQLRGRWNSNAEGWQNMVITNTTISDVSADGKDLPYTCFIKNGTTYVLQSSTQAVANIEYNYYTCVDIIPSPHNADIIFFRILTEKNLQGDNDTVVSVLSSQTKNFSMICQKNQTELPIGYHMLLKEGYEASLADTTCPGILQGDFYTNFTTEADYNKCPGGFELNGCDRTHITFNYTTCGGGTSGSPNYTCLTTVRDVNVTHTLIFMTEEDTSGQTDRYQYACLTVTNTENGEVKIVKSAETCGASTHATMLANETLSCRAPTTTAPEQTTQSGSINTTQNSSSASEGPGTGSGNQGGEGEGEGSSSASVSIYGIFTMLAAILFRVLIAPDQ